VSQVTIFLLSDWISSDECYDKLDMPVERKQIFTLDSTCFICKSLISEPYILCAVCECVMLCTSCFANGQEKANHKNDHDYMIVKNNFTLIKGSEWTAKEEKTLLNLLQECGFGNWIDISHRLPGKSPVDCKRHYLQHYIDNQSLLGLPKIEDNAVSLFGAESIPYTFKLENIEEPPRFVAGTLNFKLMAGYNAARSDFEINFDNHAELLVANLNYKEFSPKDSYYELGQELQLALFGIYNSRLKERDRRRKIIREHGLISSRKTVSSFQRYAGTISKTLIERLRIFTQLVDGIQFDSILECLHRIGELKNYLRQFFHYRINGIQYFHSVPIFEELSKLRQHYEKERKQYINQIQYNWHNVIQNPNENILISSNISRRKIAPPLYLHPGMIGYEKLSGAEKELCSVARVLPEVYIDIKHLLISENKKCGSVKLAQARQLLKIDVNKTKKIHEFLIKEGYINNI
jgi:transcriptional adapter 2-alpha